MKSVFLYLVLMLFQSSSLLHAEKIKVNEKELNETIKTSLFKYKLDSNFVIDIVSWESNHVSNVVSIFGYDWDKKRTKHIKQACSVLSTFIGSKSLKCTNNSIHVYPENYYGIVLLDNYLSKNKYLNYDAGLMQINKENIKSLDLSLTVLISDYKINVDTGVKLLKQCYLAMGKNTKKTIECYNKGTNERKFGNFNYFANILDMNQKRTNTLSLE